MKIPVLLLLAVTSNWQLCAQIPHLFEVPAGSKYGYIDSSGRLVIGALYRNATEFSEGLAAVRENGRYGYINAAGDYTLKPVYDYALPFESGIAKVFIKGRPLFIDHQGRQILPGGIAAVKIFGKLAIVRTESGRAGLIEVNHFSFILDTIYGHISGFSGGVATIKKYEAKYTRKQLPMAVIDMAGNFIVPFGKYGVIGDFSEGCAGVTKGKYPKQRYGLIDTKGHEIYSRESPIIYAPACPYYNGRAKFCTYQPWDFLDDEKKLAHIPNYSGYLDLWGNIVYRDTGINSKENFSDGRVFIKKAEDQYYIYDTAFQEIGTMNYSRFTRGGFVDGLAIVRDNAYWGIIDTSGRIVVPFNYMDIEGIDGDIFFHSRLDGYDNKLYGFSKLAGESIFPMALQDYDSRGFINGLIKRRDGWTTGLYQPAGKDCMERRQPW
jgi:WG containing repeat